MSHSLISKTFIAAGALALTAFLAPAFADDREDADALFAAQNWAEATVAYETVLQANPDDANAWFNLASARQQLEDFTGARDAYVKAIDAGYQPVARARLRLARVLMSLGKKKKALRELEEIAETGGPNFRTIQNTAEFEPLADEPRFQAVIDALRPCNTDEYRQFDFWLGAWDVTAAGAPAPGANSKISPAHDGCVVTEDYDSSGGAFTGMSINFYDANTQKWHQTWMSNAGGALYLEGGLNADGAMVLSDKHLLAPGAEGPINRIIWTPNEDGSVRQFWDSSTDGEENWSIVFDGLYTKKAEAE